MQTPTTISSSGVIKINIDSRGMFKDTLNVMNDSGLLRIMLLLLLIAIAIRGVKYVIRRKRREARERKRAKIWKEEYKDR